LSVNDSIDTRTAAGRLVLNVLASVSQWEREATAERTTEALKAKYKRGEFCGGRLRYGYENRNGQIVKNDREQEALKMARRLKEKAHSLRGIAEELEAAGFVNRKGNRFSTSVVSNMLKEVPA
jgi:DNA invertase Pin-like site-specific DNA recombinase